MFDQRKCFSAFMIYLDEANKSPDSKLVLYMKDGRTITISVPLPDSSFSEEPMGEVIVVDFKTKTG